MSPVERPSFKELYEAQTKKLDEIEKRMGRLEKGFLVVIGLLVAPKVGGPDASKAIAEAIKLYFANL